MKRAPTRTAPWEQPFIAANALAEKADSGWGRSSSANQPMSDSLSGSVSVGSPVKSRVT